MALLIDKYVKKKDSVVEVEDRKPLLIDKYIKKEEVTEPVEPPSFFDKAKKKIGDVAGKIFESVKKSPIGIGSPIGLGLPGYELEGAVDALANKLSESPIVRNTLAEISKRTSGTGIQATILSARPDLTFSQAYEALRKSQVENDDTLQEQFLTGLKDTVPQTAIGVALNFVPIAGRPLSVAYWSAISAGGEIEEKGRFTPSNVAIDVIGDRILGNTIEGLFKAPAKSIISAVKKAFVAEGGTEVAQDLLKFANDYRKSSDTEERNEILNQAKNYFTSGQILVTAGVGGVAGGGIAAGGVGVQRIASRQESVVAPKTTTGETLATGQTVEAVVGDQRVVGKLQISDTGEVNVFTDDGNIHTFIQKRSGEVSQITKVISRSTTGFTKTPGIKPSIATSNKVVTYSGGDTRFSTTDKEFAKQFGKPVKRTLNISEVLDTRNPEHRSRLENVLGENRVAEMINRTDNGLPNHAKKGEQELLIKAAGEAGFKYIALSETDVQTKFEGRDVISYASTEAGEQVAKVKQEPKAISPPTKGEEALIQEARKYKSAEEFVKAQPKLYRGEGGTNQFSGKTAFIEGRNYAKDSSRAETFGKVGEYSLDPNARVLKINTVGKELDTIAKELGVSENSILSPSRLRQELSAKGYDAVEYTTRLGKNGKLDPDGKIVTDVIVLNDDAIKTKSQLTDIYTQSRSGLTPKAKPKKEVKAPREIAQLQEKTIEKKIETTKDIKGVRDTLKSIRQELENAVTEAEGRAVVAQEQRAGLNVEDINQLKRIYAINRKFQEGDIETIRASEKVGPLLNRVLENIQEKNPGLSEQEAFDFAINLPTKVDEKTRTSEIVQLEKKEKQLRKYMDQLKAKQKELNIQESELLTKEWESVLAAQEKLTQLIKVPESQLPVGEGKERVSRLVARVKDALGRITPEEQDLLGLSTYRQMNKADQIEKASKYVSENTDEALKVLKGEVEPPTGLLRNSVYVAMKELGSADTQIATQIASLASTRLGQEISILSEIDADSPVSLMEDVVKARIEGYKRKGKDVAKSVKRESDKISITKPGKADWDGFLASIRC